jgi:hypothetical protein
VTLIRRTLPSRPRAALFVILAFFVIVARARAQRGTGELRLQIHDETGAAVQASGTLEGQATHVRRTFTTGANGTYAATELPFGVYALYIEAPGFTPAEAIIDVRSEIPRAWPVTLTVAPLQANVTVNAGERTLLDPYRPSSAQFIGADLLRDRPSARPGRSIVDLINTQPGWLLEANGVLHPRASEYQVQYVIDGIPLRDNRSPAFAQSLGAEEFQAMTVRTAGYPAEFGGKLGGVIELTTTRESREGLHGTVDLQRGSFGSISGDAAAHVVSGATSAGISVEGMRTDRYLDPPVEDNFTNHGSGGAVSLHAERRWSESDRTRVYADYHRTRFDVPNEALQQAAGQHQTRDADELLAQIGHDKVFSSSMLGSVRLMVRDDGATLSSNAESFPIRASQDRGLRELYANGSVSMRRGAHEIKIGGELIAGSIREQFASTIVNRRPNGIRVFDGDIPLNFSFAARHGDEEQSLFAQDLVRLGAVTLTAGLRYDHYALMVHEHALSPRASVAWFLAPATMTLHVTYDRAFQTPPLENILLASTDLVDALGGEGQSLPLRSSRANFYEAGLSKAFGGKLRLDANYYYRHGSNFGDDELLLNTAVSFPIAFSQGTVKGFEAKIDVPRWGAFSGWLSYANARAEGRLPLSGGLFLGNEVTDQLTSTETFPITQDQRNTVRGRLRYQAASRLWLGLAMHYNSGLPVEIDGTPNLAVLVEQYGQAVVDRVDFDRGRVKPSSSIDASAGVDVWRRTHQSGRLQLDVFNLTDRLNVINFAGLLSGTALGTGRTVAIRLQAGF